MLVSDFDYELPRDLIAQTERLGIADLPRLLRAGDVLVVNDTRVFPARLIGRRDPSGGAVECLLLSRIDLDCWDALVHPGQKLKPGSRFVCEGPGGRLCGEILARHTFGRRTIRLKADAGYDVDAVIEAIGHVPLPPYIHRPDTHVDRERYQTVFARERGSVAAPTAGLHFTGPLLDALRAAGIVVTRITLHVGYGTFKPVRVERVEEHHVDAERYSIGEASAVEIDRALAERRRIVAVGTTTTRALETAAMVRGGRLGPGEGTSDLFIFPGFRFQVVDGLLTNFHLPRSSLLMLVSAFGGREHVLAAYREAVANRFRFYSYGDAMLIL
jgi:S-adenosylmethionine:tRNA ribosyltransferase-isomerase